MVVLARIDDRLIHGQVVEGWVQFLKATSILVADDEVAANPLQRSIFELSVPEGMRVVIGTVAEICARLGSAEPAGERAILLFSNPSDVVRFLQAGQTFAAVNIGGMHYVPGKQRIMDVLAVNEIDKGALREILRRGIKVEVQTVPSERPVPLEKLMPPDAGAAGGTS